MGSYNGKCYYDRCWLPENNKKYLWQTIIVLVATLVLFLSEESFTFFALLLVISPVMLDIVYTEIKSRVLNAVRVIFGFSNGVLIALSFLGFAKVLVDNGSSFGIPETYMYFAGFTIKKKYIGVVVFLDIIVPIILGIGAPCQKALRTMEENMKLKEKLKRKEAKKE